MKTCSKCSESKPLTQFYKHKLSKDGHQYWCKPCIRAANTEFAKRNPGRLKLLISNWNKAHPELRRASAAKWRASNPERARALGRESDKRRDKAKRRASIERNRKSLNARAALWRAQNPAKCRAFEQRRRAYQLQAMPAWADNKKIVRFYEDARRLGMTVDHIVPLKSKLVCGLHVEHNLQLLPASENFRKSNRYWPDMP